MPVKWSKDGQAANWDDRRQGENASREENTIGSKLEIWPIPFFSYYFVTDQLNILLYLTYGHYPFQNYYKKKKEERINGWQGLILEKPKD